MKIVLLADLHANRDWYEWLVAQTPQYDLISVAGDLLDIFAVDESGQIGYLRNTWLPAMLANGVPVAISSGNHDGSAVMWLSYISQIDRVIGDSSTQLVIIPSGEQIIVSTIPYYRSFQQHDPETRALWEQGANLREKENVPWLVLHHEPTTALAERDTIVAHHLADGIDKYRPDFVGCGHFHRAAETSFAHHVGHTWVFNAGQRLDAPKPNHIILDTAAMTATRVRMQPLANRLSWYQHRDLITLT